jgi:hypothetical protein
VVTASVWGGLIDCCGFGTRVSGAAGNPYYLSSTPKLLSPGTGKDAK